MADSYLQLSAMPSFPLDAGRPVARNASSADVSIIGSAYLTRRSILHDPHRYLWTSGHSKVHLSYARSSDSTNASQICDLHSSQKARDDALLRKNFMLSQYCTFESQSGNYNKKQLVLGMHFDSLRQQQSKSRCLFCDEFTVANQRRNSLMANLRRDSAFV